jgi:hypothetical protein
MPCWEVRTMSVEFRAKNRKLLEQALDALGWSWWEHESNVLTVSGLGTLCLEEGQAVIPQTAQGRLNRLKQQYSKQALKRAAKLQGWQLKAKGQKGVLRR